MNGWQGITNALHRHLAMVRHRAATDKRPRRLLDTDRLHRLVKPKGIRTLAKELLRKVVKTIADKQKKGSVRVLT